LKKRIRSFFATDGGGGSVARINNSFLGKGENFFTDAAEEKIATSPRKIPTAHCVFEKDVAAKQLIRFWEVEAEAAWAVAWDVEEPSLRPGGWGRSRFVEELGGVNGPEFLGKTEGEHGIRFEAEEGTVGMIVNWATGPFRNVGGIPDMVPMSVGDKEGVRFDFLFLQEIEEAFGGIDRKEMAAEVQKVGVGCGEAAGVGQRLVHLVLG